MELTSASNDVNTKLNNAADRGPPERTYSSKNLENPTGTPRLQLNSRLHVSVQPPQCRNSLWLKIGLKQSCEQPVVGHSVDPSRRQRQRPTTPRPIHSTFQPPFAGHVITASSQPQPRLKPYCSSGNCCSILSRSLL